MKHYLVTSKPDDYGACLTELVCTTFECAKEYYTFEEVHATDVIHLSNYFDVVPADVETERSNSRRFYGQE